jgi:glycosyltransferase involved in cell wall biosynthesis
MASTLYINGRFRAQKLSGVQRFATEITAALQAVDADRVVVLAPRGSPGRWRAQLWEQMELPAQVAGGVLINLGNMAPVRVRRQLVVLHDAGVFATPQAYSWQLRLWYKHVHRQLAGRAARIVTVSAFARDELSRTLGVPAGAIAVISEGADHMAGITADPAILRKLPTDGFVLAVGNLAAHKNLSALGTLAAALAARAMSLVITGGLAAGPFRHGSALPQPACYLGRVSDAELKALYQAARCLVFPSLYEGFGLPAIEAMTCSCPVAASRIPAIQETCADAALYFDPASSTDIAGQVSRLIDNAALRQSLRQAGLARATGFTWARAAAQLAAIADSIPEP